MSDLLLGPEKSEWGRDQRGLTRTSWMGLARADLAASSLLCTIIELGHMGRFGLHSEIEHFLKQGLWCVLHLPAIPILVPEVLVALSSGSHPTFPLQLKFLTAASSSRFSLTLLHTSGLEACQTRPKGHSFLRKADFSSRGGLPAGGCHARQIADASPPWPSESEMLACQSALR